MFSSFPARWLVAFCLTLTVLTGQEVPGEYIVELAEQLPAGPASKTTARRSAVQAQQRGARAAVTLKGAVVTGAVQTVANALLVNATPEQAAEIGQLPGVVFVEPVRIVRAYLDRAVLFHRVFDASVLAGNLGGGIGMKIGIIDTGIDNSHPGLQDDSLPELAGFPRTGDDADIKYTNRKVIVARTYSGTSARDAQGHGTGVAMAAAGGLSSGPRGAISGFAPKAYLGNYKALGDDGKSTSGSVLRAIDDAVADGMDVINLSLGGFPAARPADDSLARAVDRATAAGVIVVIAAGNEGPGSGTIGSPATAATAISVGNHSNDRIFATLAKLDGSDPFTSIAGSGPAPYARMSGPLVDVMSVDPSGLACEALPPGSLQGAIAFIYRGSCNFEDKLNHAQKAGAIAGLVYARLESPEAITMAAGSSTLPSMMVNNADGFAIRRRLQDGSATATLFFQPTAVSVDPFRLSSSSSRGPNSDGTLKPDLSAIGSSVYTAGPLESRSQGYQVISGTSISSPMVAGAAAVLKAGRPGLNAYQYRSLLVNSAQQFAVSVQQTGSGILDVAAAMRSTVTAIPSSLSFGTGGGTVNIARSFTLNNLSRETETYAISVEPVGNSITPLLSTDSLTVGPGESQTVTLRLREGNLNPGEYSGLVQLRGSRADSQARLPYWYGVPSDTPANLYVDSNVPETGKVSSTQSILVRVTDRSGIPQLSNPTAKVEGGDGSVMDFHSVDSRYPGFYNLRVKLGAEKGPNVFVVEAGTLSARISITGN